MQGNMPTISEKEETAPGPRTVMAKRRLLFFQVVVI
ncbi:hypothetical protein B14911_21168 [Bacillus sp. NRRL B-14911]|nr:hypothetical protein B14911_21168 [Bacillus sp. NRRL B-14911]